MSFNCFIRDNEIRKAENNKGDWADPTFRCPKFRWLNDNTKSKFREEGKPCENPKLYFNPKATSTIEILYDRSPRIRKTRIIPLMKFSGFVDVLFWLYCQGEEAFSRKAARKADSAAKESESALSLFYEIWGSLAQK